MSFPLFAAEKLGTMAVDEVLLRPSFKVAEGQDAEFNIGESSFSLSWFKTQDLGGVIRIGPESLINPMLHFQDDVSDRIAIVEAFAQVKGVYGRLRMGLIPIEFGIEGSWLESEMTFSRS
ncbi:MAG: hypothetical protein KDD40_12235, partial [Bdellovibrionales bacterium]|nr:hypothetical protein [Bdellovibrionales bacterium]